MGVSLSSSHSQSMTNSRDTSNITKKWWIAMARGMSKHDSTKCTTTPEAGLLFQFHYFKLAVYDIRYISFNKILYPFPDFQSTGFFRSVSSLSLSNASRLTGVTSSKNSLWNLAIASSSSFLHISVWIVRFCEQSRLICATRSSLMRIIFSAFWIASTDDLWNGSIEVRL